MSIRTLTKEQFDRLVPHEQHLVRALKGRYVYALNKNTFDELSAIYRELGYTQRLDHTCNSCVLNLCTTLANLYFPFKSQMETEVINEDVSENTNEDVNEDANESETPEEKPIEETMEKPDEKPIELPEEKPVEKTEPKAKKTNDNKTKKVNK